MKHLFLIGLSLLAVACKGEATQTVQADPAGVGADATVARAVHDVECGCRIDGINKCGNYLAWEGAYLPIAKTGAGAELGVMEWCGAPGSKAECEGTIVDGEFLATFIKTVEP